MASFDKIVRLPAWRFVKRVAAQWSRMLGEPDPSLPREETVFQPRRYIERRER